MRDDFGENHVIGGQAAARLRVCLRDAVPSRTRDGRDRTGNMCLSVWLQDQSSGGIGDTMLMCLMVGLWDWKSFDVGS